MRTFIKQSCHCSYTCMCLFLWAIPVFRLNENNTIRTLIKKKTMYELAPSYHKQNCTCISFCRDKRWQKFIFFCEIKCNKLPLRRTITTTTTIKSKKKSLSTTKQSGWFCMCVLYLVFYFNRIEKKKKVIPSNVCVCDVFNWTIQRTRSQF